MTGFCKSLHSSNINSDAVTDPPGESTLNMTAFVSSSYFILRKLLTTLRANLSSIPPLICTIAIFSLDFLLYCGSYSFFYFFQW